MKHIIATALLILSSAPAMATEITDDTPARPITIAKEEGDLNRVVITNNVLPMAKCKEMLEANAEELKASAVMILCVPADLTDAKDLFIGDLPLIDLTK
ncbi:MULTISPECIES: hypothetical protein [unclassified Ensifer]|uniref:hypothetical protein n=1 Tax=unclassified Ensifer TaxID=2633371 RepID=UPI000813A0EA|nr:MULTISPECIES: hypothetical protein [unclassified Ensifer]OCP21940.1 hypothetical protein BC361_25565 [Ensifer sp. LC54]OCP23280.1 hypothetical protein BC363_25200 [Ensifer sp. LC384]